MTLRYFPETDSLYLELRAGPGVETVEVREGLNMDLDAKGEVVGFDMDRASTRCDLSRIEVVNLPPALAGATEGIRAEEGQA